MNGYYRATMAVAVCLAVFGARRSDAQEYQVRGQITYRIYTKTELQHELRKEFVVDVSGERSLIRTTDPGSGDYAEKSFEGGTIYSLYVFHTTTNGVPSVRKVTRIENYEVPDDDVSLINYLWLAYASAGYFPHVTNGLLEPIWELDDRSLRAEHFAMRGEWRLGDGTPRLPVEVRYLSDGFYRIESRGQRVKFPVPKPFDRGYTNAAYEATAFTNVANLLVPSEFVFTRFYVQGTNLLPRTVTVASASLVKGGTPVQLFRPQFEGVASTHDLRFRDGPKPVRSVVYKSTNSLWHEMAALTNQYAASLQRAERSKRNAAAGKRVGTYRVVFMAGFLVATVIFFVTVRRNQQQKRQ